MVRLRKATAAAWAGCMVGCITGCLASCATSVVQPKHDTDAVPAVFLESPRSLRIIGDDLMKRLQQDPEFQAVGDRLFQRIAQDQRVDSLSQGFLARMIQSPRVVTAIKAALAGGGPNAQEAFQAQLQARVEATFADPDFDAALMQAIDTAMKSPSVSRAMETWTGALLRRAGADRELAQLYLSAEWKRGWVGLLGSYKSDVDLIRRIDRYLASPEGAGTAEILLRSIVEDPVLRDALLLVFDHPDLATPLAEAALPLLESASFTAAAIDVMAGIIEGTPPTQLVPVVRELGQEPALTGAFASMFFALGRHDQINQRLGDMFRRLVQRLRTRDEIRQAIFGGMVALGASPPGDRLARVHPWTGRCRKLAARYQGLPSAPHHRGLADCLACDPARHQLVPDLPQGFCVCA